MFGRKKMERKLLGQKMLHPLRGNLTFDFFGFVLGFSFLSARQHELPLRLYVYFTNLSRPIDCILKCYK